MVPRSRSITAHIAGVALLPFLCLEASLWPVLPWGDARSRQVERHLASTLEVQPSCIGFRVSYLRARPAAWFGLVLVEGVRARSRSSESITIRSMQLSPVRRQFSS